MRSFIFYTIGFIIGVIVTKIVLHINEAYWWRR